MVDQHDKKPDIDRETGVETTGHEWDGIKELNNPLPRWWLWTFYATIVWTIGITIAYPAWPMLTEHTKGLLGYTARGELAKEIAAAKAEQSVYTDRIAALPLEEIQADDELLRFARAGGASTFKAFCSQCHGSGAAGGVGYPNLNDDDWIWGGGVDEIHHTIVHGIRQTDEEGWETDETRAGNMPAFGRDELLEREQIAAVVEHVLQISGQPHDAAVLGDGAVIYEENCASCHGDAGEGLVDFGAPNLSDAIWLYGGDRETITATILNGRAGMMPAWNTRLDEAALKSVALYVHGLGGGE